jgi:tetratricopeptide (TPR) repeat protein
MGAERVAAEPEAVDHIITACGRSPMALAVVSARVALHPDLRLSTVADALGEATAFSWSYDLLTPAARHLFRGFGAHPAQDLSTIDAGVILAGKSTVDSLTELARAQLITEVRPGRYAMHALLREHAAARTPDAEREALEDRIVEHGSSFAVLGLAMRRRRYRDAWRIADAVDNHLDATGRWDDRIAAQEIAIRAAEHLGAPALLARAQRAQSAAYLRTGQHEAALRRLREAADCFHAQGDPAAAAHCRQDLAALLESMARFAEAIVHDELALALFRRAGDHHGQATAHAAAAWHYAQAGRAAEAVAHGEAALALHRELDDPHEVAAALAHLGRVHAALGERERSLERLRAALDRYTELGDRLDEADTATRLGDALDGAPAIGLWRRAHAIYERLGHPAAATVAARLGI